eukprot:jgi/Tetstr1/465501/TSEL_000884.t1
MSSGRVPECPVCLDRLGSAGRPVSLPCGHNGCQDCFASVQATNAQCPLCRAPFDSSAPLPVNYDLDFLMSACVPPPDWELVSSDQAPRLYAEGGIAAAVPPGAAPPSAPAAPDGMLSQAWGGTLGSSGPVTGDVLALEPPQWQPDSASPSCTACARPFSFYHPRHHCRLCGRLVCGDCSACRLLMPPKFHMQEPQRACRACAELLHPLQPVLADRCSAACRPAVQDVLDWSVPRSWINLPLMQPLPREIYKCANIVQTALSQGWGRAHLGRLRTARGVVILSAAKAGLAWSVGFGSGVVCARLPDGRWSAPVAVGCAGISWGLQGGCQVVDQLLALHTDAALAAFCRGGSAASPSGGVGAGLTAGGAGLRGGADLMTAYSISRAKGVYAGISMEGNIFFNRPAANHAFYGQPFTAEQLLTGAVPAPVAACQPLHAALDKLVSPTTALPLVPNDTEAEARDARPETAAAAAATTVVAA